MDITKDIEAIKLAGFTHLKVELEAHLERGYSHNEECEDCDGGRISCYQCDGLGVLDEDEECSDCNGEGSNACDYCDGYGRRESDNELDDDDCYNIVRAGLTQDMRNAITYDSFEDDGSVDSEYTFTIPIDNADMLPEFVRVFASLGEKSGTLDVTNAGMHMAVLTSGSYPSRPVLSEEKCRNFRTQVTKLLPALFFTAAHAPTTRGMSFRSPRVSEYEKYSAIYIQRDRGCIEYRLFDTCYDKPEAILDNIAVIAKTLKFYGAAEVHLNLPSSVGFPDGAALARMYNTPEKLRLLNQGLEYLKGHKSPKTLKEERQFKVTHRGLLKEQRLNIARHKADYEEYIAGEERSVRRAYPNVLREIEREGYRNAPDLSTMPDPSTATLEEMRATIQEFTPWNARNTLTLKQFAANSNRERFRIES